MASTRWTGARGTVRPEEWREWPSVKAHLPSLPVGTTTWDIYKNLSRFGRLDFIRIEETRQGASSRTAHVTFKPPPPRWAPWDARYRNGIDFVVRDGTFAVKVYYSSHQSPRHTVESPVRRGLQYAAETVMHGHSLGFGYLESASTMVVKATAPAPQLLLYLHRLELEVRFPVAIRSGDKQSQRAYRFFVALDDQFGLCAVEEEGQTSLVIHLRRPPWYSRQFKEAMQLSHDPESYRWSAEDTWSRQTDLVDDKELFAAINRTPISIRKLHNTVDIARWTTFRVVLKAGSRAAVMLPQMLRALEDFNIPVVRTSSFRIVAATPTPAPAWALLDSPVGKPQSLGEQLSSLYLDFGLRYQLEVCVSNGWLNEYTVDAPFLHRLTALPLHRAIQMLVHVDSYRQRVFDPMSIFDDLRYAKPALARPLPPHCIEMYNCTVTATGVIFHTPAAEMTNRVIRKYLRISDRFLRVRFEDDAYRGKTRLYPASNGKMTLIFERVRRALKRGIVVADRHYEFLAWGNSQLREHGAYFFAATQHPAPITCDSIRTAMGVFDREKVVAKRAARMGQCFSTTRPVSIISQRSWMEKPITDTVNGKYVFTDGVGKISPLNAQLVHQALRLKGPMPSAFQFRLGGCKGVLAVDPTLAGVDIKIRPSQYKFDSQSDELEVIRVSEFWQPFLNRQLILVLSDLGVPDHILLQKQSGCIRALEQALVDDNAALQCLRDNVDPNQSTLGIAAMIEHGFRRSNDPFVTSLLRLYRAWTLKYLKEKAKIPVAKGAFVLGVADETHTLRGHKNREHLESPSAAGKEAKLPEIFLQYTDQHKNEPVVLEGICIVARNPSLHRGDIRVVKAVRNPKLHHLRDVLVMPSVGDRDLPSMCSGGDLDGDDYLVIWDPDLIPPEWNAEPFDYLAPPPVTKDEISIDDIVNFFCDYMQNDSLGRIAHAHLAAADFLDDGIRSEQCLELVRLHSMAVDYPKTGVPAKMNRALERTKWPHFMEKKRSAQYHSRKILGQLYDAVEKVKFEPNWAGTFDSRILQHQPPPNILDEVAKLKKSYDESLRRIMAQHQIKTEFEVWSTFVLDHSKAARDFKFHEEIGRHSRTLKEQYYDAFVQEAGGRDGGGYLHENLAPFAVAAYHVTHDEVQRVLAGQRQHGSGDAETASDMVVDHDSFDMPFISFPWVLQDVLCRVASGTALPESGESQSAAVSDPVKAPNRTPWLRYRDHLPDPYMPEPPMTEEGQLDDSLASGVKLEQATDARRTSSESLHGTLSTAKVELTDEVLVSEESSNVSSALNSLDTESSSTSPEDLFPPDLAPSRSSHDLLFEGELSRTVFSQAPSEGAVSTVVEGTIFKDPALMTAEEYASTGLQPDSDDDEDYSY